MHELAMVVNREVGIPDVLITVTYVDCSPDLKQARVGFSVLPENQTGSASRRLQGLTGQIAGILRSRLNWRRFPHLIWEFDPTEKEAGKIERLIAGIDDAED